MLSLETVEAIKKSFGVLFLGTNFRRLLGGLWVTVWIALVSVAFSWVVGCLFGILMTNYKPDYKNR